MTEPAYPPHPEPTGYAAAEPPRPVSWWRRPRTIVVVVAAVVLLAVVGWVAATFLFLQPSPLAQARDTCHLVGEGVTLTDDDKTLIIDTKGNDDVTGADIPSLACVLKQLKTPAAVIDHIDTTRALDGRQTDKWADYRAGWTYHPDDGLNLVIQVG